MCSSDLIICYNFPGIDGSNGLFFSIENSGRTCMLQHFRCHGTTFYNAALLGYISPQYSNATWCRSCTGIGSTCRLSTPSPMDLDDLDSLFALQRSDTARLAFRDIDLESYLHMIPTLNSGTKTWSYLAKA